jgi:hypothetical protein
MTAGSLSATVKLEWGRLALQSIALGFPQGAAKRVLVDGRPARFVQRGSRVVIELPARRTLAAGQELCITIR